METRELLHALRRVEAGELTAAALHERLTGQAQPDLGPDDRLLSAETPDACVDLDRQQRCGFPEVVFAEGKSTAAIVEILGTLADAGQHALATRVSPQQAAGVVRRFSDAVHNPVARTVRLMTDTRPADSETTGIVSVITAGTSDRPVAEEAAETLAWMQVPCEMVLDVGVAGPHRLVSQRERFAGADAVVVVAGMEGALPSVVGGYVDCPVIAVPTSVGYGASFSGVAALLGMLNSCAANVAVVNIDAGFKGGYLAGLIARRSGRSVR